MTKITTQEQLNQMIDRTNDGVLQCFVTLNLGLRSSKEIEIYYNDSTSYYVYNEIDDYGDIISFAEFKDSFIGEAMEKGALFAYN